MAELLRVRDNRLTGLAESRSRSLRVLRGHIAGCPTCAEALAELRAVAPLKRAMNAGADQLSQAEPHGEARGEAIESSATRQTLETTGSATLAELLRQRTVRPPLPDAESGDPRPLPVRRLVLVCVLLVVAAVVGNYFRS